MKLIVAADKNWGIGRNGKLLCHISGDLKYFKEKTMGKTVVMGRKTLESLPGGKPLPGRTNIVLTRDRGFNKKGCYIVHSLEQLAQKYGAQDLMVIGGAEIYTQLLDDCDCCYITEIDEDFEADKFIPNLSRHPHFEKVWESKPQEENGITYRFTEYRRIHNDKEK